MSYHWEIKSEYTEYIEFYPVIILTVIHLNIHQKGCCN